MEEVELQQQNVYSSSPLLLFFTPWQCNNFIAITTITTIISVDEMIAKIQLN